MSALVRGLIVDPVRMVAGLWSRRDLIAQFTQRSIELRHRGSRLGAVWALINPLSMLALYYVLFGVIYGTKFGVVPGETGFDVLLAMFLGLSLFHAFSETISWAPNVIASNPNFVKKVVFPLEVLPVAQIGAAAFHLGVGMVLVLIGCCFATAGISWSALWLPVLILPLLMLALGCAWFLAAVGVFLRDIGQLSGFVTTVLQFASAVMFPVEMIARRSPELWTVLRFNPLLQIADLARRTVLWHQPMAFDKLLYVYVCAAIVLAVGAVFFSLLRKSFAEVI
ncbi:MAG: ABC transporter permease [Opitutaceae bacterium]|nr:ABC transporter permease [Opitutaceae bacterium]